MSSERRFCDPNFPGLEGRRLTHFPEVLYYVVDDPSTDSIISWGQNGKSFVFWNMDKFCSDILPKFNLRAIQLPFFIRKLQGFKFRKVEESEQWEYAHDHHFVRGKPELTHEIEQALWDRFAPKTRADWEKFLKEAPPPGPAFIVDRNDPVFLERRKAVLQAMAEKQALGADGAFIVDRNDPVFLERRKAVLQAMAEKKALGADGASKLTI